LNLVIAFPRRRSFSLGATWLLFAAYCSVLAGGVCALILSALWLSCHAVELEQEWVADWSSLSYQMAHLDAEFDGKIGANGLFGPAPENLPVLKSALWSNTGRTQDEDLEIEELCARVLDFTPALQVPVISASPRAQSHVFSHHVPQGNYIQVVQSAAASDNFFILPQKSSSIREDLTSFASGSHSEEGMSGRFSALALEGREVEHVIKNPTRSQRPQSQRMSASSFAVTRARPLPPAVPALEPSIPDQRRDSTTILFQQPFPDFPGRYLSSARVTRAEKADSRIQYVSARPDFNASALQLESLVAAAASQLSPRAADDEPLAGAGADLLVDSQPDQGYSGYPLPGPKSADAHDGAALARGLPDGQTWSEEPPDRAYEKSDPERVESVLSGHLPNQKRRSLARLQRQPVGYGDVELSASIVRMDRRSPTPSATAWLAPPRGGSSQGPRPTIWRS
jgi:hypothetical protein